MPRLTKAEKQAQADAAIIDKLLASIAEGDVTKKPAKKRLERLAKVLKSKPKAPWIARSESIDSKTGEVVKHEIVGILETPHAREESAVIYHKKGGAVFGPYATNRRQRRELTRLVMRRMVHNKKRRGEHAANLPYSNEATS